MTKQVKPIPEGYHSVTPYLAVQDGARAIDFYKRAFGAAEIMRMNGPDGNVGHAEIKIGDSIIMLGTAPPNSGLNTPETLRASTVNIFLYVPDVDTVYNQALASGAREVQRPENMFWGDRYGRLTDPFGHSWSIATHVEEVSPEEMGRRAQEAAKSAQRAQAAGHGGSR